MLDDLEWAKRRKSVNLYQCEISPICSFEDRRIAHLEGNLVNILLDLGIGELSSDKTLCSEECVFRVDNGLSLSWKTDEL